MLDIIGAIVYIKNTMRNRGQLQTYRTMRDHAKSAIAQNQNVQVISRTEFGELHLQPGPVHVVVHSSVGEEVEGESNVERERRTQA
jgi:hypothetical protein